MLYELLTVDRTLKETAFVGIHGRAEKVIGAQALHSPCVQQATLSADRLG